MVADSAQFSAIVSETTDDEYLGTALTVQTCLGFLLTMVSIRLTSAAAEWVGWQWAFLLILPGPILGVQAMVALMKPRIRRSRGTGLTGAAEPRGHRNREAAGDRQSRGAGASP